MKKPFYARFSVLGVLLVTSASAQNKVDWKKIDNQFFSFSVPATFKKKNVHPIDSFVEKYVARGTELMVDYGPYSNNFQGWPKETSFEQLKVDGRSARIGMVTNVVHYSLFHRSFPYSIQIHVVLDAQDSLSMMVDCKSQKDIAVARKIFESIAFKQEKKP